MSTVVRVHILTVVKVHMLTVRVIISPADSAHMSTAARINTSS